VGLEPARNHGDALADVIDAVLDKGLVINADIMVSLAGVELLGIKIRAALASFETAARYGLEFPSGTNLQAPGWQAALPAARAADEVPVPVPVPVTLSRTAARATPA
jgi:gas vesicle structural protein